MRAKYWNRRRFENADLTRKDPMSIAHKRLQSLEKRMATSSALQQSLTTLLAATPEQFAQFIGVAFREANERQLKAVSTDSEVTRRFVTVQFFDALLAEADAEEATRV